MSKELELRQLLEEIGSALPSDLSRKVQLIRAELTRARRAHEIARKWEKYWTSAAEPATEKEDFATARLCKACAQAARHIAEDLEKDL